MLEGEPPEDDIAPEIVPKATLEVPRRISTKTKPSTSPDSCLHPAAPAPPDSTVAPELLSTPARRITSKSKVSGLIAVENRGRQELVTQFLQHPDLLQLGQGNRKITEQNRNSLYAVFRAFQHGGVVGITRATKDHSDLVRQACQILCQDHPGEVFTSFVVSRNSSVPIHQDRNNDPATCNLISPLCVPSSGGVWVEVQVGDPLMSDDIRYQEYGGKSIFGCVLPVGKPVRVKPNRWHCTADWTSDDGDRFLVIGYTIKGWHKLSHQDLQSLAHAGVSGVQAANLPSQGVDAQTPAPVPQTESVPQGSQAIGLHSTSQVQVHATQVPAVSFAGESANACTVQSHAGDLDLGAQTQVPGQGACISARRAQVQTRVCSDPEPVVHFPTDRHTSYRMAPRTSSGGGDTQENYEFGTVCPVRLCLQPGLEPSHEESRGLGSGFRKAECGSDIVKAQLAAFDVPYQEPALTPVMDERKSVDPDKGINHVKRAHGRGHTRRWYDMLPEDPGERFSEEGGLLDRASDDELEDKIQSLDAARSCLLSVVREEENCLRYEAAKGEGEGTLNALREASNSLHFIEEQLVELQNEQTGCLLPRVASASTQEPEVTPEILHTHTVSLEEVHRDLGNWVAPMKEEVNSLEDTHNALSNITHEQIKKLEQEGKTVLWVPSKIVPTIKAGTGRKKVRIVACGNFLSKEKSRGSPTLSRSDVFTSSLDSLSLRLQLALASLKGWTLIAIDVKTAFLTAPIGGGREDKVVTVKPAKILITAGIIPPNTLYRVDRALYGLHESPKDWGIDRDNKLRVMEYKVGDQKRSLVQARSDCSVWLVCPEGVRPDGDSISDAPFTPLALLGIYVDDLLISGPAEEAEALLNAIKHTWTCSEEQRLDQQTIKFCGLEVDREPESGALLVHQSSYIGELESRHGSLYSLSLPTFKDDEDEPEPTMEQIREAQGLTGELTWITCRSRPDIAFSISRIARMVSKRPVAATKAAKQVIGYLIATRGYRLRYGGETDPELNSHLLQSRDIRIVESFSDASFGCDSGRSQSGVVVLFGGCPVGWLSLTQPFTTLSTCEAELVAACKGLAVTQALLPLWREIAGVIPTWLAYSDSISCTAILMYPSGNWRTKHLRLRAKVYQELVEEGLLLLTHIPGRLQVADLLTKSLSKSRMDDLLRFLGYGGLPVKAEVSAEDPSSLRIISAGNDIEWGIPGTGGVAKFLRLAIVSGLPELVQAQGNEPLWIVQVRWRWVFFRCSGYDCLDIVAMVSTGA